MAQANLRVVSPAPQATSNWPDANDVADLLAIVEAQTVTIKDQAALIDRYQGILNAAQVQTKPTVAIGTGTASGTPATTLAVSGVTNPIVVGAVINGAGIPPVSSTVPPTTILSQQTGTTGGAGNYTTNQATTASAAVLTFTPPPSAPTWPIPQDAPTLTLLAQEQSAVTRTQSALIQHYQDVLNTSQTPIS
jgi:hypothetical protein